MNEHEHTEPGSETFYSQFEVPTNNPEQAEIVRKHGILVQFNEAIYHWSKKQQARADLILKDIPDTPENSQQIYEAYADVKNIFTYNTLSRALITAHQEDISERIKGHEVLIDAINQVNPDIFGQSELQYNYAKEVFEQFPVLDGTRIEGTYSPKSYTLEQLYSLAEKQLGDFCKTYTPDTPKTPKTIENMTQLVTALTEQNSIKHDAMNSYFLISSILSLYEEDLENPPLEENLKISLSSTTLSDQLKSIEETLEPTSSPKDISLNTVKDVIRTKIVAFGHPTGKRSLYTLQNVSITSSLDQKDADEKVLWGKTNVQRLVSNIAQNAIRVYDNMDLGAQQNGQDMVAKRNLTIEVGTRTYSSSQIDQQQVLITNPSVLRDGQRYLEITVDDDGTGFPPKILEHGFGLGISEYQGGYVQGTGIGMNAQQELIHKVGGTFMLTNRRKEDGTINGARLTVLLPITSPTQSPA